MGSKGETVCVTGASGFIGSWLVMRLLERGYTVRATVRDPGNEKKVKHLLELPKAKTHLTLWKADLANEGSFNEAVKGCTGVFHVATPMDFESKDPENEIIRPTVVGMIDIMKACLEAKVKRLVFTSSAGTVNVQPQRKSSYDESSWTDVEFCRTVKMTGWMYFVSKTIAEQEAFKFAKENNMDFITVIPTLVIGSFISPSLPPSFLTGLSPITGNEAHYQIIAQGQFVHLDDLCEAHIFLYENPKAQGRYIASSHCATIYELAKILKEKYPEYNVPTKFKGYDENIQNVELSSKKLKDLGFEFKHSLEDMFIEAVETCRAKGLIPLAHESKPNGKPENKPNGISHECKPADKPKGIAHEWKPEDKPNGAA